MANLNGADLKIEWNWGAEAYDVTGHIEFMFGATRYRLKINQQTKIPVEYANVADQVEHLFIDIAAQLGKLNNAQLTLEADTVETYL